MWSGRHLLFLGALACAGLLSVRESQEQVRLGYEVARLEGKIRALRKQIARTRANLENVRTPARVMARVAELKLDVAPRSPISVNAPARQGGPMPSLEHRP